MASTAHAAKVALFEVIESALSSDSEVQVSFGDPGRDIKRICVFLSDIDPEPQEWATLGALHKDETYVIDGWVMVTDPGMTERDASARTFEITELIETTLRTRSNVSGLAGTYEISYRDGPSYGRPTTEGRVFGHNFSIRCKARI